MEITIDNTMPTGVATLVDMRNSIMLQHGGVATRMEFDTLKQMDVETFLRVEVPNLKKQTDQLYVIRNAAAGECTLILDDQVLKYNVTNINDIGLDTMKKYIQDKNQDKMFVTDIQYPLVAIVTGKTQRRITVRVPSHHHRMNLPMCGIHTRIWSPDCWFRLNLSLANVPLDAAIVVTPSATVKAMDTPMHMLPYSNVFNGHNSSGWICFGDSQCLMPSGMELTDAVLVHQRLQMFFESNFNDHLVGDFPDWTGMLGSAFDEAKNRDKYNEIAKRWSKPMAGFIKTICVLEEPEAWRKLRYPRHAFSADYFIRGGE